MARILLLTQVLPYPPDSGPKVKTYNVLKYLARQHEVTLVSFARGDQSADIAHLRTLCAAVHTAPMTRPVWRDALALGRSMLNGQPWMMLRDDRAAMRALIDAMCGAQRFDFVHADQLNMAQYARRARARTPGLKTVLDLHNALWVLYRRQAANMGGPRKLLLERDWRLLKSYEAAACAEFDHVMAVSEEDRAALAEAGAAGAGKILVIPITVDGDEKPVVTRATDAGHILHIGTMYWPPNIDAIRWFIGEVLPLIRAERPDVVFDCVGARPPQDLVDLGARDSRINVTGYVADALPFHEQAGVTIVPVLAGGGVRVKILDWMAQGMPIVTTTVGCEGIRVVHGESAMIADTPADFACAVLAVLADRALADRLGANARATFERLYDYRAALKPMDQLFA